MAATGSGAPSRDLRRRVEDLADAAHRGLAALEDVDHPAQRDHRPVQHGEVGAEGHELAEGDGARDHHAAAQPEHEGRARAHEELDAGVEAAEHADERAVALQVLLVRGLEARHLVRLLGVGAHHARPGEVLLHERVHVGELRLHRLEAVVDAAAEVAHEDGDEEQRHQRQPEQPAG